MFSDSSIAAGLSIDDQGGQEGLRADAAEGLMRAHLVAVDHGSQKLAQDRIEVLEGGALDQVLAQAAP